MKENNLNRAVVRFSGQASEAGGGKSRFVADFHLEAKPNGGSTWNMTVSLNNNQLNGATQNDLLGRIMMETQD